MSMSSLSSLNLSTPSGSPSPPVPSFQDHLMLSMQYSGNKKVKSGTKSRRFSGTFIPEHHIIALPSTLKKVKKIGMRHGKKRETVVKLIICACALKLC